MNPWRIFLVGLLLGMAPVASGEAQVYEGVELVHANLVADRTAVVPGQTISFGVLLDLAPGWHVYWRNPGDAGLATKLQWEWPEGWEASPVNWPVPRRIIEPGDLQVFAYKKQVLLWQQVRVPEDFTGSEATVRVRATWLVCEAICIPGAASLELTLPVETSAQPQNEALFAEYAAQLPQTGTPPFALDWRAQANGWQLTLSGEFPGADFFPDELPDGSLPIEGHTKLESVSDGSTRLFIPGTQAVRGLVVVPASEGGKMTGWLVESPAWAGPNPGGAETPTEVNPPGTTAAPPDSTPLATSGLPLWLALFYGFVGGFILNLMPCVLPVISLKIFGFIRQAGESPWRIFTHGLSFFAGICTWFLGLGVLIVLLKNSGAQVTWAFQFQNPWFIWLIAILVFVFALNLFGVFEVALPGRAGSSMSGLAEREGLSGSFFQGIFATLLATPCTAPFLGTALGFAFSQPSGVILAMFASVAAGMGFPYLLLSARPGWIRYLPKPGAWMERLKQFMGFPLLATLVWLLSVISGQKGEAGIIWTLALLCALALACWLYGAFCGALSSGRTRWVAGLTALLLVAGGGYYFGGAFARALPPEAKPTTNAADSIAWQPFSQAALDELLEAGRPVFVDFTADWCITCKFNERTAINTPAVRALLAEKNTVAIKADWTNANPEITSALEKFGRVGVPFYVFYPAGNRVPPVTFPELLTEKIFLEGLQAGLDAAKKLPE
jgi:thiol:disulfide interchange protein DsbD